MKQKFKTWWYSFRRSILDSSYYADVAKAKFSFSLKYMYLLMGFSVAIGTLPLFIFALTALPGISKNIPATKAKIAEAFPKDLSITIAHGELSTTAQQPYVVKLSQITHDPKDNLNLLTIDTSATFDDYAGMKTSVLMTKKYMVYPDRNGQSYQVMQYSDSTVPLEINPITYHDAIVRFVWPVLDRSNLIMGGLMVLWVLILPLISMSKVSLTLLALLFLTLASLLIFRVQKLNYSYKTLFRMGMHAITLSVVVDTFLSLLNYDIPYLYPGIFIVWMIMISTRLKTIS
jgi:hypothetical protein